MKFILRFLCSMGCMLAMTSCLSGQDVRTYGFKVEESFPHDVSSYTQGLFFYEGELFESSGQYGESNFRRLDPVSGKVLQRMDFEGRYFVEGSCVLNERLYILSWQENECFVYDIKSWTKLGTLRYLGEGWGLTSDGRSLIMSNGTSTISFRNPADFSVERSIEVTLHGKKVLYLNELEYIKGEIWANVYGSDIIVRIDPSTGVVRSVVNCTGLLPASLRSRRTDVLNGIAYNPADGGIYLTGKYWPKLYKVKLIEKKNR